MAESHDMYRARVAELGADDLGREREPTEDQKTDWAERPFVADDIKGSIASGSAEHIAKKDDGHLVRIAELIRRAGSPQPSAQGDERSHGLRLSLGCGHSMLKERVRPREHTGSQQMRAAATSRPARRCSRATRPEACRHSAAPLQRQQAHPRGVAQWA